VRTVSNSITNALTLVGGGKTISQPINTDGNLSMNFWGGVGFKIKKLDMRVNFNPNANYRKYATVINGITNNSKTLNAAMSVYLSKSKDKKYDVSVSNDFSYNRNKTSQNSATVNKYYVNSTGVNATVYYKKVWSLSTDYDLSVRQKTVQLPNNLSNSIWNARFKRTFKKDEFTAYFLVRDILNQNVGIDRNFDGIYTTEVRNDRLKRYFMVGFTWDFKNSAAKAK
jgi:hypothetical protein